MHWQDVEWIREHTRLREAAARWQARGSGTETAEDLLLRGVELANAETRAARRRDDAPAITPLLHSFLTASEAAVKARAQQERDRLAEREQLVSEREAAQLETALSQETVERAQRSVRQVQRRWAKVLVSLTVGYAGDGCRSVGGLRGLAGPHDPRSGFIAGLVDRQTGEGDHVTAMLLGLEALPDPTSESIRQRWLPLEMTAVNALYSAWRNWRTEWGERAILSVHAATTEPILALAFSPDGTRILTGSHDTARLWDAASGKPIATLAGGAGGAVGAVDLSPDGTRVLFSDNDPYTCESLNTARLRDAASGKPVATLAGHKGRIRAVAFAPDGTRVVTGCDDNTARVWRAFKTVQELIDTVRASMPRCLAPQQREAFYLGTPPPHWCYTRKLWPFTD